MSRAAKTALPAASARLDRVILWSALVLILFAPKVYDDACKGTGWRAGVFLAALVLQLLNLLDCRRLLTKGDFGAALKRVTWGTLLMFTVGALHADGNPATPVLPIIIASLALPHVSEREFIRFSLLCLAALVLNTVVVALWPLQLQESPGEHAFGHIFATSAAAGVCLLLFWQIRESMQQGGEERQTAQAEAEFEEERYHKVLESAREGIWLLGLNGETLVMNPPMREILSHGGAEELAARISGSCLKGKTMQQEFQQHPLGGPPRWILVNANALRDAQGQISGAVAAATDISELKQAQGRVSQALGIEAEGRLASGIAHDMNNVLAVIQGGCELAAQRLEGAPEPSQAHQALAEISASVQGASELVQQLLTGHSPEGGGAPAAPGGQAAPPGGLKRLLLVDDDPDVRGVAARLLRLEGYDVIEAGNAKEAEKIMLELGDSVNLLISDVMMPGLSGPELAQRLKQRHPALKVLFISGFAGDELPGGHAFLAKPFSTAELSSQVRAALGEAGT
jgi:CheY-like chemotaxis protein